MSDLSCGTGQSGDCGNEFLKLELPQELRAAIAELLEIKKITTEKEENPQMPVIQAFIESETARQKDIADKMPDDHNKDWTALNQVFRSVIGNWSGI